jgi:hypothetical protein
MSKAETVPRVLANEKPVFSGSQGSPKVLRVMNSVANGDNYTKVGFFQSLVKLTPFM